MRRWFLVAAAAAACGRSATLGSSDVGSRVNVSVAVSGPGAIRGAGLSGDCRTSCSFSVAAGSTVHLSAAADGSATFAGWSGPCSGTASCDVVANADLSIGATFTANAVTHKVQVSVVGAGAVHSTPAGLDCVQSCAASIADGTSLTLVATPAAGWQFVGFSGDCTGATCALTVASDAQVIATFAQSVATLSVQMTGSGAVVSTPAGIDCPRICSATFAAATSVSLTATPAAGFTFSGFSGACSGPLCPLVLSGDSNVQAAFTAVPTHRLTVALSGTGKGSVTSDPAGIDCPDTCTATFQEGTAVTLTATPDPMSRLTLWAGACTSSPCAVKLQADSAAVAQFDNRRYVVLDLGTIPGGWWSGAAGISPNGNYVSGNAGGAGDLFFWDGNMVALGVTAYGTAGGVNDFGTMTGSYQANPQSGALQAFRYDRGQTLSLLATLGGPSSWAYAINASGVVAGWSTRADGMPRAAVWTGSTPADLGSLAGGYNGCSYGYGINSAGVVVGESCLDRGGTHAVRFRAPGLVDDLGSLGGTYGSAQAINDAGVIVGQSSIGTGETHAFVYDGTRMIDAGVLPGLAYSKLVAINRLGIAAGTAFDVNGVQHGLVWAAGRLIDVNTIVEPTPYTILTLTGVDDAGALVGLGQDSGVSRAVILRPE